LPAAAIFVKPTKRSAPMPSACLLASPCRCSGPIDPLPRIRRDFGLSDLAHHHRSQSTGRHPIARHTRAGAYLRVPIRWRDRTGCAGVRKPLAPRVARPRPQSLVRARHFRKLACSRKPQSFQLRWADTMSQENLKSFYLFTNAASPTDICTLNANQKTQGPPSHDVDVFGDLGVLIFAMVDICHGRGRDTRRCPCQREMHQSSSDYVRPAPLSWGALV
jgi:hypothetical protein